MPAISQPFFDGTIGDIVFVVLVIVIARIIWVMGYNRE